MWIPGDCWFYIPEGRRCSADTLDQYSSLRELNHRSYNHLFTLITRCVAIIQTCLLLSMSSQTASLNHSELCLMFSKGDNSKSWHQNFLLNVGWWKCICGLSGGDTLNVCTLWWQTNVVVDVWCIDNIMVISRYGENTYISIFCSITRI